MRKQIIFSGLSCALILSMQGAVFAESKAMPSGVTGSVGLSPGCPGPEIKDQPCTKPLAGKEVQLLNSAGKVVGKATTGDDGKFTINAKHGKYALKIIVDAMYPKCPMTEVTIKRHSITKTNISCDSGMR